MTINDILTTPLTTLLGGTAALSATAVGTAAFARWLVERFTRRLETREARVDTGNDKLLGGTMSWATGLLEWGNGLMSAVAECQAHHAECMDHNAKLSEEVGLLRAQIGARGAIAQEAQKIVALNTRERSDRQEKSP